MNRKQYDLSGAQALVPLLDSILREMQERRSELGRMEASKRQLSANHGEGHDEVRYLIADIANTKRELRHAQEELEQLGCKLEETDSLLVHIPGEDEGWMWSPTTDLEPCAASAA